MVWHILVSTFLMVKVKTSYLAMHIEDVQQLDILQKSDCQMITNNIDWGTPYRNIIFMCEITFETLGFRISFHISHLYAEA